MKHSVEERNRILNRDRRLLVDFYLLPTTSYLLSSSFKFRPPLKVPVTFSCFPGVKQDLVSRRARNQGKSILIKKKPPYLCGIY